MTREEWFGELQTMLEAAIDNAPDSACKAFANTLWDMTAEPLGDEKTRWWLSWWTPAGGSWELHSPWWISGEKVNMNTGDVLAHSVVAAVVAPTAEEAKRIVESVHDATQLEWRFCERRPDDWSPFSDRFPRASWMRWP